MKEEFLVNIRPGSSILGTYKNQSYKIENAFAEFIDNSTQSFISHKKELAAIGQHKCHINIEIYPEYIKIYDNAFGMEVEDFKRALKLDSPPEDTSGRCEKGMGLKTSATCLGSLWSVETTMFGSRNKYKAIVDVDEITRNSPEAVTATKEECDENEHYTIIKIEILNKKISANKINSLIRSLSEMYSLDIRNEELVMTVNKEPIKYQKPELWINQSTGSAYMTTFERQFEVDGKAYSFDGWVGIRATADTEFSGLTLFRKGRAIKIHYRPTKLVGKPNLYPYQRIIGEVNLKGDNWEPSYTKDELMWEGDVEDRFIEELKSAAGAIIAKSSELRKEDKPISKENKKQIASNINKSFKSIDNSKLEQIVNTVVDSEIEKEVSQSLKNSIDSAVREDEFEPVEIDVQGVHYVFNVKFENNDFNDWIKIHTKNQQSEYDLIINYGLEFFSGLGKTKSNLEFLQKMAITVCVSIITSKNNGNSDAYKILSIINSIIRSVK